MFSPLVHIPGGSYVTVHITPDIYIDARKSEVYPGVSFVEEVVNGKVKPATLSLMNSLLKQL